MNIDIVLVSMIDQTSFSFFNGIKCFPLCLNEDLEWRSNEHNE